MAAASASEKLAELETASREAHAAAVEAQERARHERFSAAIEATAGLKAYADGIIFRKFGPDPNRARALTEELLDAVRDNPDLTFAVHSSPAGPALTVQDLSLEREANAAQAADVAARKALREHRKEHADALAAEAHEAEAERLRTAIEDGDLATVRDVVGAG